MKALAVGGTSDHVHALLSLPGTMSPAEGAKVIKASSSKWIHGTFPERRAFAWQAGYGAFSVSVSRAADTIAYIRRQEQHHRRTTFRDEFLAFPEKHNIPCDPRYVFG